jgi:hypothetical protein
MYPKMLDFSRIKTYPLSERKSQINIGDIVNPNTKVHLGQISYEELKQLRKCATAIKVARAKEKGIFVLSGAHLVKNGGVLLVNELVNASFFSHICSNMAFAIHDYELGFHGKTSECVKSGVKEGKFGTWETSERIHSALLGYQGPQKGIGFALGQSMTVPNYPLSREYSIIYNAFLNKTPVGIFPHIGHDITICSPHYNGKLMGACGHKDFDTYTSALHEGIDGGVVLVIGSSVMAPQITEKAISIVNNLRIQDGQKICHNFDIFVVDIQPNNWDWNNGEPPKDNPSYYLRMCKSFSRLGQSSLNYIQMDNIAFLRYLHTLLLK